MSAVWRQGPAQVMLALCTGPGFPYDDGQWRLMADPLDSAEHALVVKAVALGRRFKGCCEWKESSARRLREKPPCEGLTPEGVKELLIQHIEQGGDLFQVLEKRDEYADHRFYYKAVVAVPGLIRGLFVEVALADDES
jgi:hypothetical protein